MVVWYLILSMSQGLIALPQTDHKQCIENRSLQKERGIYLTYCVRGAPGMIMSGSKVEDDD